MMIIFNMFCACLIQKNNYKVSINVYIKKVKIIWIYVVYPNLETKKMSGVGLCWETTINKNASKCSTSSFVDYNAKVVWKSVKMSNYTSIYKTYITVYIQFV
jgi:hypothetical protein